MTCDQYKGHILVKISSHAFAALAHELLQFSCYALEFDFNKLEIYEALLSCKGRKFPFLLRSYEHKKTKHAKISINFTTPIFRSNFTIIFFLNDVVHETISYLDRMHGQGVGRRRPMNFVLSSFWKYFSFCSTMRVFVFSICTRYLVFLQTTSFKSVFSSILVDTIGEL